MKKIFMFLIIICLWELTGCCEQLSPDAMVYKPQSVLLPKNKHLTRGIIVGDAISGRASDSPFISDLRDSDLRKVLIESLRENNLYNSTWENRYVLNAVLTRLTMYSGNPGNRGAACTIHYTLINLKTDKILYTRDILNFYAGGKLNLKIAVEGAIRSNVGELINDLEKLPA